MGLDLKVTVVIIEMLAHFNSSVFFFSYYMIVKKIENKNPH